MKYIKNVRDITNITTGELFLGIHVVKNKKIFLSRNKWTSDNETKNSSNSNIEEIVFQYFDNEYIKKITKDKVLCFFDRNSINFLDYIRNGKIFLRSGKLKEQKIIKGKSVGVMSLGENIFAIKPYIIEEYRPDFYDIFVLHKVIHSGKIKWILFSSKQVRKNIVINNPKDLFMNVELPLV